MDIFITILIGAAKFLGFAFLVLPIATGILFGTSHEGHTNKLAKFYFVTWPIIMFTCILIAMFILIFYVIGKEGFKNA